MMLVRLADLPGGRIGRYQSLTTILRAESSHFRKLRPQIAAPPMAQITEITPPS
jgi:hypothetical protein